MSGLVLPRSVAAEIEKEQWAAERQEWRAKVEAMFDFQDPVCLEWNPHLKNIDRRLRLGLAHGLAYEKGWPVQPGFYHWVRDNETAAPTIAPITGPAGERCEPSSRVLEDLKGTDLHDPRVFGALLAQREQVEQARAKREAVDRQERQDEMLERWAAASRTQVLTSSDVRWSQNHAGRRGKKTGE